MLVMVMLETRGSYRYAMLIVFANYLIEMKSVGRETSFEKWLSEHREITKLLEKRSLD
jgi:hypothetical protein